MWLRDVVYGSRSLAQKTSALIGCAGHTELQCVRHSPPEIRPACPSFEASGCSLRTNESPMWLRMLVESTMFVTNLMPDCFVRAIGKPSSILNAIPIVIY